MTELSCVKQELIEKQNELDVLTRSFEEYMESSREVEKEFEGMLTETEQKLNDCKLKSRQLEDKLNTSQAALANANKEIGKLSADYETANKKWIESEHRKTTIECENDMLKEKWRILESTEDDLRAKLERVEEDLVFAQSDYDVLQMSSQETERRDAETLMELRQELAQLQQRLAQQTWGGSNDQGEKATPEDMENHSSNSSYYQSPNSSNERITELESLNADLQAKVDAFTEQQKTNQGAVHRSLQNSSENDQQQILQLQSQCSHLMMQMDKLTQRYTDELAEFGRHQEQHQREIQEFQEELHTARGSIHHLNETVRQRDNECASLAERLEIQMIELSGAQQLVQSVTAVGEEMTDSQGSILASLEQTMQDMRLRLEESAAECQTLREECAQLQYQSHLSADRFLVDINSEKEQRRMDKEAYELGLEAVRVEHRAELDSLTLRVIEKEGVVKNLEQVCADWQHRFEAAALQLQQQGDSHTQGQGPRPRRRESAGSSSDGASWTLLPTWSGVTSPIPTASDSASLSKDQHDHLRASMPYSLETRGTAEEAVQLALMSNSADRIKTELLVQLTRFQGLQERNHRLLLKLQQSRADIQIMCRVRPFLAVEQFQNHEFCFDQVSAQEIACYVKREKAWKSFHFDHVWCADVDETIADGGSGTSTSAAGVGTHANSEASARIAEAQTQVFMEIEPNLFSLLDGVNVLICACGRTSSGKSFTLNGRGGTGWEDNGADEDGGSAYGLTYRLLARLFEVLQTRQREVRERADAAERNRALTWHTTDSPLGSPTLTHRHGRERGHQHNSGSGSLFDSGDGRDGEGFPDRGLSGVRGGGGSAHYVTDVEESVFYYQVKLSMLEVYNETVRDLLNPTDSTAGAETEAGSRGLQSLHTLEVTEDSGKHGHGGMSIPGLTQVLVSTFSDSVAVYGKGMTNRALSVTDVNQHASRSHCIFMADVTSCMGSAKSLHMTNSSGLTDTGTGSQLKHARMYLVDTAGTEHIHWHSHGSSAGSGSSKCSAKESQCINRSLSALGEVLQKLTEAKAKKAQTPVSSGSSGSHTHSDNGHHSNNSSNHEHDRQRRNETVPIKNSKLTMVLSDCFRVDTPARIVVIATLSPAAAAVEDSLFTLQYVTRLKALSARSRREQEHEQEHALVAAHPHTSSPGHNGTAVGVHATDSSTTVRVRQLEEEVKALRAENQQLAQTQAQTQARALHTATSSNSLSTALTVVHGASSNVVANGARGLSDIRHSVQSLQEQQRDVKELSSRYEREFSGLQMNLREMKARMAGLEGERARRVAVSAISGREHGGMLWHGSTDSGLNHQQGLDRDNNKYGTVADPNSNLDTGVLTLTGASAPPAKKRPSVTFRDEQISDKNGDVNGTDFTGQVQFVPAPPRKHIIPVMTFDPDDDDVATAPTLAVSSLPSSSHGHSSGHGNSGRGAMRDNIAAVATGILMKSSTSRAHESPSVTTNTNANTTAGSASASAVAAAGPNFYSNISDYYAANATGAVRAQPKDRPAPTEESEINDNNSSGSYGTNEANAGNRGTVHALSPSQAQRITPAKKSRAGPQYSTPGRSPSRLTGVNDVVSELYKNSVSRDNGNGRGSRRSSSPGAGIGARTSNAPVVTSASAGVSAIPMRTPPRRAGSTYGYNVGGSGQSISSTASTVYLQSLSSRNTPLTPYNDSTSVSGTGSRTPVSGGKFTSSSAHGSTAGAASPGTPRAGRSPAPQRPIGSQSHDSSAGTPSRTTPSRQQSTSPGSAVSRAAAAEIKHQERIRKSKEKANDRHFDSHTF